MSDYNSLVSACSGIDPNAAEDCQFLVSQMQRGATPQEASAAWTATLKARTEIAREEAAKAVREQSTRANLPGVDPLTQSHSGPSGALTPAGASREFHDKIAEYQGRGMNRQRAASQAAIDYPELVATMRGE